MDLTRRERAAFASVLARVTQSQPEICGNVIRQAYLLDYEAMKAFVARADTLQVEPFPCCPGCYMKGSIQAVPCPDLEHRSYQKALLRHQRKVSAAAPAPPADPEPPRPAGILDQFDMVELVRSCSSKKRYSTESYAKGVAADCYERRGHRLRVYPCSICHGFHLTHLLQVPESPRAL